MVRFVLLLLGARLRLTTNGIRRATPMGKLGWIAAGAFMLGMAVFSGLAGFGLVRLLDALQDPKVVLYLNEVGIPLTFVQPGLLLRSLLSVLVLLVWGIIVLSSLGAALGNFYLASDLDLLVAAPIPMRAIFTAKFLEGLGVGYLLLFTVGGPALVGLGLGAGYRWPYYVGAVLVLLLVPLVPESLGTLLVMPLVRVIPPKRLREVLQALGAVVGAAFYFLSQLPRGTIDPQAASYLVRWLYRLDLPFLPQGWVAHGLMALGEGQYLSALVGLGAFVLLSLGLYALCLIAAERLYYSGWASLQMAPAAPRPRRARRMRPAREVRFIPRQVQAIVAKDLRLFVRDPQGWSQMLMPLAVYAIFVFQLLRGRSSGDSLPVQSASWFVGAMVLFLSTSMFSRLGLGGIGSEGKHLWLLLEAPLPPRRLLWAKLLASYLPLVAVGGVLLLVLPLTGSVDWALFLANWLLLALVGLGTTGIGVGLGASFPRLDAEKPRQVVSTGAGYLYFPLIMGYAAIIVLMIVVPPLVGAYLTPLGLSMLTWLLWAIGPLGAVILTALALWLPLRIGVKRLEEMEV